MVSINPYFSLEGPKGYTKITMGAIQKGTTDQFYIYMLQITQNLPGQDPITIAREYNARPFFKYNVPASAYPQPGMAEPWPNTSQTYNANFSLMHGGFHNNTDDFASQLITRFTILEWQRETVSGI